MQGWSPSPSLSSGLCRAPAPWAVPAGTEQDLCRVLGLQMWFSLSEKYPGFPDLYLFFITLFLTQNDEPKVVFLEE